MSIDQIDHLIVTCAFCLLPQSSIPLAHYVRPPRLVLVVDSEKHVMIIRVPRVRGVDISYV